MELCDSFLDKIAYEAYCLCSHFYVLAIIEALTKLENNNFSSIMRVISGVEDDDKT